jgi:hypothetical protein
MKKNRWIFYAIFGFFHLSAFIFTIMLENDSGMLFTMAKYIKQMKWVTLFGLVLLIVDVVWAYAAHRAYEREQSTYASEMNTLKAKLFDIQEKNRNLPPSSTPQQGTKAGV